MNSLVLDTGCGTGQNLVNIMSKITHHAFGFDISHHASPFWSQRGLKQVCLASINDIPFPNDTFDAAISIDVLECHEVCEGRAYSELWRVVKMGGFVVLVVPAYKWLFSKSHDRAVHASRRYSERMVLSLLRTRPVEIIQLTHLFASLLPAAAAISPYRNVRDEVRTMCQGRFVEVYVKCPLEVLINRDAKGGSFNG